MFLAMILYLLLVLIRPQDYPDMADTSAPVLLPLALILAAVFWLLSTRKRFDSPQYLLLLAFLLVLMLSNIANGWFGGALLQLTKFAPVVLAFVVLANASNSRARLKAVFAVFVLCAGVLALHGIDQARTGIGWTGTELSQGTRIQYIGIFNDPNDLGLLFVICLPMAVYLATRGGIAKILWWSVVGVLLYGIYLTNSRGTLLATLAVFGAYIWWRRGFVMAAALAGSAMAGLMMLPSRMQDMDVSEASAYGRVESWYEGLQMFRAHPLFGVGADMYSDLYHLTAHNSFILVLAETGVIGFTLWLAFFGYCFRMMLAAVSTDGAIGDIEIDNDASHSPSELAEAQAEADMHDLQWHEDRALALTLLLSLVGMVVSAFFLSRSYLVVLYLLAAMVVAHYTRMRDQYTVLPVFALHRDLLRWPATAVGSVVGLYIAVKVLLVVSA